MKEEQFHYEKEDVKYILKNYEALLKELEIKKKNLQKEVEETTQAIWEASVSRQGIEEPSGKHGHIYKDLTAVILRQEKILNERRKLLFHEIHKLILKEESIRRIYIIFQSLPMEEYNILYQLYIQKKPYKMVLKLFDGSEKKMLRLLNQGIETIMFRYSKTIL